MEAYRKSNGRRSKQKKSKRQKPKGVKNNEEDKHGEITRKKNYEESKMKVSEGESITVFLCLHHVTSVYSIVLNYTETDFFLVTEL